MLMSVKALASVGSRVSWGDDCLDKGVQVEAVLPLQDRQRFTGLRGAWAGEKQRQGQIQLGGARTVEIHGCHYSGVHGAGQLWTLKREGVPVPPLLIMVPGSWLR